MKNQMCPKCTGVAHRQETKYGIRNHCCDLWSWGDAPLVDAATHLARREAHHFFDQVWKLKIMPRSDAYKWLARRLRITEEECHMKLMDEAMATRVIKIVRPYLRMKRKSL